MGYKKKSKKNLTYIGKDGYKRFSDSGIKVHRHVAERKIGRKLKPGEQVHHKNRKKEDNRRSNLHVFSSGKKHYNAHKKDKKRTGKW